MATRLLTDKIITADATDVTNGYVTVDASLEIHVHTLSRAGAVNTLFTENSPSDGKVTIPTILLGEVLTFLYIV